MSTAKNKPAKPIAKKPPAKSRRVGTAHHSAPNKPATGKPFDRTRDTFATLAAEAKTRAAKKPPGQSGPPKLSFHTPAPCVTLADVQASALKAHPLAEIWPLMPAPEFLSLKESINAVGLKRKILRHNGLILDGRNRHLACVELGVTPEFEEYRGDTSEFGIAQTIIALNGGRNLDTSQRGMIGAELLPRFESVAAERKKALGKAAAEKQHGRVPAFLPTPTGESRDIVARLFAVSARTISDCKAILVANPTLAAEVKRGEINVSRAKRVILRAAKTRAFKHLATRHRLDPGQMEIHIGDCRAVLAKIPPRSIDLVFADPPYNIGDNYHGYKDNLPETKYLAMMQEWIALLPSILTLSGSVFVMIDARHSDQVGVMLRESGLERFDSIIWFESFGNYNPNGWTQSYRVIHHYVRSLNSHVFNGDSILIKSDRQDQGDARADGDGRVPDNAWGVKEWDKFPRIVDNHPERIPDKIAPNQLPVALVERIVSVATKPGQTVLDPFHGTGTTARAALALGRKYIGIEIDPVVAKKSETWIKAALAARSTDSPCSP